MTQPGPPPDGHVHSQFSWDAGVRGSMADACARAVELGLPSIAFTEHLDLTSWFVPRESLHMFPRAGAHYVEADSTFYPPRIDLEGYFESIDRCRERFGSLHILTGIEIGEPHWFPELVAGILASGRFERVLGSVHSVRVDGAIRAIDEWFHSDRISGAAEATAVREYLAEATTMIEASQEFEVVAHIDYLVRQIRRAGRRHDPRVFEAEYRETLAALAASGRVLEINTRLPLDPLIVRWWHEVGGGAVCFGSDAHAPDAVGRGFGEAVAVAEAAGFKPRSDPRDFWRR